MAKQNKRTVQLFNTSTIQRVKAYAFTLAEVLIVIGIIGVVAALTLPNLNHATGDKEIVTRVKKTYSTLNEAFDRAQAIYGPVETWLSSSKCINQDDEECISNFYINRISQFMKVNNINEDVGYDSEYRVILTDGSSFGINASKYYDCNSKYYPNAKLFGVIYADIDGPNKNSSDGKDGCTFEITNQGIYPDGVDIESAEYNVWQGYGQTRWIIENGNLDYLKANEEGKCKDSNIILNWTTNTSCH